MTKPKTDPQHVIAAFANLLYEVVGKEQYYSEKELTREQWMELNGRWNVYLQDAMEGSHAGK